VEHVPDPVSGAYDEARRAYAAGCYTASTLLSRKMLMNIAVQEGADEGKHFKEYVQYLASKGFVPPNGEAWVDRIREVGNEATHEIVPKSEEDARRLIWFLEMLLKFIYEMPNRV
jgi:Domain of unknown function (DUF4145)